MISGILRGPCNDPDTLVSMLTNIFGFPNDMSLKKFSDDPYKFARCDKDGNFSCAVCSKLGIPKNELYSHIKTHVDEQYKDHLNTIMKKNDISSCCICNQVEVVPGLFYNSISENDAKDLVKSHYECHIQQLKEYMLKKVINIL